MNEGTPGGTSYRQRWHALEVFERVVPFVVAFLIALVFATQLSSLYVFPMPDSARWWGDETGQIIELKTELQEGVARIPIGLGSTVGVTNGIVRGNSWLAAFIYGIPASVFSGSCDLVSIGRTVTAVLSALLLIAMYFVCRRFGVSVVLSELAALLLLATRSFLFASHAARLDIGAGLATVVFVAVMVRVACDIRERMRETSLWTFFFFGAIAFLLATLSIHLLTLLGPVSLYLLWQLRGFERTTRILAAISGVVTVATLLFAVYLLSGAPVTLFGVTSEHTQFHSVLGELPITNLFSRSAQIANLVNRWKGMIAEAPSIVVLFGISVAALLVTLRGLLQNERVRTLATCTAIVILSWLLLQSYAIYYYVQILPLAIVCGIVLIQTAMGRAPRIVLLASVAAAFAVAHFSFYDSLAARTTGARLTNGNTSALSRIFQRPEFHGTAKPTVLIENPGVAWLLHRTTTAVMSPHFIEFPLKKVDPSDVLKAEHVGYLALYSMPGNAAYSEEVAPLRRIADSIGTRLAAETGVLFDVERSYFDLDTGRIDTLSLYSLPH